MVRTAPPEVAGQASGDHRDTADPRRLRGLLSTRGVVLAAGGLSAAVAAASQGEPDLVQLGLFVALLPLLSLAWTVLVAERGLTSLRVSRDAGPVEVASGTPVTIRLAVERTEPPSRGLPALGATLAEDLLPPGVSRLTAPPRVLLGAGATSSEIAYTIVPLRRGTIVLGPTRVRPSSPLGLCDRRIEIPSTTEITVTPRVVPLPVAVAWREPRTVGDHRPRRPGSAPTEDASIRPYRRGDDLRMVHWRSSARRGELQVREGVDLRTPRSLVVLDTSGRPGRASETFEVAVDVASSVGAGLLELAHDVDVSLFHSATVHRCRTRTDLLHRLAEAEQHDVAPLEVLSAGRGDIVVLCTHLGSGLADEAGASLLDSLPPVAGRNPALALVAVPDGAGDDEGAARLRDALNARGWVVRLLTSASALPSTWAEDTARAASVAGGGR